MESNKSETIKRNTLILSHREGAMKIGRKILRKWGVSLEEEDIRSLADIALCEAAKGFNPKRGVQFVTYLYFYVKGELAREIGKRTRMDIPVEINEIGLVKKLERELRNNGEFEFMSYSCPEADLAVKQVRRRCNEALGALSQLEREVMLRVHVYDFKVASVARSLGYSRGYLSDVKKGAASKMQKLLEPYREECLAA